MALDVKVKISLSKPIGTVGTWFPLLLTVDTTAEADVYKEFNELSDLTTGGYEATTNVYKAASLMLAQNNRPSKFAVLKLKEFSTSANTIGNYLDKGWRQIVLIDGGGTGKGGTGNNIAAIAQYIETTDKMLFATVSSTTELSTLYNATKAYERTVLVYHTDATNYPNAAAAVVGATAGLVAGGFTYKNTIIKGVTPIDISDTDLDGTDGIHAKGAITFLSKAGDVVTSEGKVVSGEFIDIIDSKDYIIQNITYNTQKVFNVNNKVPYTDVGIAMLEGAVSGVLNEAASNGMIATGEGGKPVWSTDFALRSQTSEANRAARHYPYGKFSFELSGAIHTAEINGEITV